MRHTGFEEVGGFKRSSKGARRSDKAEVRAMQHREERKNDRKAIQAARREQKRSVEF